MFNKSFVIISGLSGAGKSVGAKVLEDIGYYTIDNLPLNLVDKIIELLHQTADKKTNVALVIDSRSKDIPLAYETIKMLKERYNAILIFMDAKVETIVKRYKETRHLHPKGKDLMVAIQDEIEMMEEIKSIADMVYKSDNKSVHQLSDELTSYLNSTDTAGAINVMIESFGFKNGLPDEADMVFDVRFLKNPFFNELLKEKTGQDSDVQKFIKSDKNYAIMKSKIVDLYNFLLPQYIREGKRYLTIAIGCTGGHHRSVTLAEELFAEFNNKDGRVLLSIKHRDIKR